jgi:alkanesulfonate monooxygenase SsuD/methylene tetrahydromethanopterin reductase-like flavin-dependent oxidoreductase (luciferase family)
MDIGISIPSYIDAWQEVRAAEEAGFSHAWFFDSQLIYSDVYATMALAAQNTERIRLGTLVAIPTNRIAPVTASAIATINKLAPGRVTLALGTGYTGRNTMGLPAVPVPYFKQYTSDVKGLLAGEDVLFREGNRERWIRLVHADRDSFINIHDPIPVFMAANGQKALQAVGEIADGWVTIGAGRDLDPDRAVVHQAAQAAGRDDFNPYTVANIAGCVLHEGESMTSDRVMANVAPNLVMRLHAQWEAGYGPGSNLGQPGTTEAASKYDSYIRQYAEQSGTPSDRLYLDVHRGHMVFMKPGEEDFISENDIARTLTGSPSHIMERLEAIEATGVDSLVIQAPNAAAARDLIRDFPREALPKRG